MSADARAVRALEDVVAVEEVAPGMARVCTWSDQYVVDARGEGCACPDKEYNLGPDERCKHELSALMADVDRLPSPWINETQRGTPSVMADGGDPSTCPHGRAFCPVENPDAREDALECFDCFVEQGATA